MRVLDRATKAEVQKVIDQSLPLLKDGPRLRIRGAWVSLVDGTILKKPAIIVFVSRKLRVHFGAGTRVWGRKLGTPY
ncbi:hypothetical protein ABIF93_005794 [Bradyrhizobium japonicum]